MTDIQVDLENFDLIFENGDLKTGNTSQQNQTLILLTSQGEWRNAPWIGANVLQYLKDYDFLGLEQNLQKQLKNDGMNVESVQINTSILDQPKIEIKGEYE